MSDSNITTRTNLAANRQKFLRKRYRAEKRFRLYGISAIAATTLFVVALLVSVSYSAIPAFTHHSAVFEVDLLAEKSPPMVGMVAIMLRWCGTRFMPPSQTLQHGATNAL